MVSKKIEQIRKKFQREWLLIDVDKMDEKTTTPLTGKLLFHSPHNDEVHQVALKHRGQLLLIHSDGRFPKGYVAAF